MNESAVKEEIIDPMQRIFTPPKAMDAQQQIAALRDYVDALSAFSVPVLRGAWKEVRDNHTARSWPLPSVFIAAAKRVHADLKAERKWAEGRENSQAKDSPWERWTAVRSTDLAKASVRQNVAWALKCAILDGIDPNRISIPDLAMKKEKALATAARIQERQPIFHQGVTLRFREDQREVALEGFAACARREAETQAEILRGS